MLRRNVCILVIPVIIALTPSELLLAESCKNSEKGFWSIFSEINISSKGLQTRCESRLGLSQEVDGIDTDYFVSEITDGEFRFSNSGAHNLYQVESLDQLNFFSIEGVSERKALKGVTEHSLPDLESLPGFKNRYPK